MDEQKDIDRFDQVLQKYLRGEATDDEIELVEKWYSSVENTKLHMGFFEKFQLKARILRKLNAHRFQKTSRSSSAVVSGGQKEFWFPLRISTAIAIVCIAIVAYIFLIRIPSGGELDENLSGLDRNFSNEARVQVIVNTGTSAKVIMLADGSQLSLSAGGVIHISDSFNIINREIFLKKGEGFFEVKRDVTKPFLIYTDQVTTKVLGTSFTVDVRKPDVVVAVKTGRVSVLSNEALLHTDQPDRSLELILTPNQQVKYDSNQGKMSITLVEDPSIIIPAEDLKEMRFESTKVPVILDAASKAYGVEIKYDSALLSTCRLTTYFSQNENLYKRLNIICEVIGATYTVEGVTIKINSNGCLSKTKI